MGQCEVTARLDGIDAETEVSVMPNGVALCGRGMIAALDIDLNKYFAKMVRQAKDGTVTIDQIFRKNARKYSVMSRAALKNALNSD